ncbi:MAG TPA: hypothetical protein VGM88_20010 [Kofleriaceae bacterium]|jgi:hypothetical protein
MKLALLALCFGACIPMRPAGSTTTASGSPGGDPPPPASSGWSNASGPSGTASPGPAPAAPPGPVSVSIHTSCGQTVQVFYGEKPGFSSGTKSSLESNSTESHSFRVGEQMWIIDDHENGITSITISEQTRSLDVGCNAISTR